MTHMKQERLHLSVLLGFLWLGIKGEFPGLGFEVERDDGGGIFSFKYFSIFILR